MTDNRPVHITVEQPAKPDGEFAVTVEFGNAEQVHHMYLHRDAAEELFIRLGDALEAWLRKENVLRLAQTAEKVRGYKGRLR